MIAYLSDSPPFSPCSPLDFSFFKRYPVRRALLELGSNDPKLNMRMAESLLTISAEKFMSKWNFDPITMRPKEGKFIWTPVKRGDSTPKRDRSSVPLISSTVITSTTVEKNCDQPAKETPQTCSRIPQPADIADEERTSASEFSGRRQGGPASNQRHHNQSFPAEDVGLHPPQLTSKLLMSPSGRATRSSVDRSPCSNSSSMETRQATTPKSRQSKITEYGRQRKRLYSRSDEEFEVSPRKKLLLETVPCKVESTSPLETVVLE